MKGSNKPYAVRHDEQLDDLMEDYRDEQAEAEGEDTQPLRLFKLPLGAVEKRIPKAAMAPQAEGAASRATNAPDGEYFERLEEQGIRLNTAQIKAVRHHNGPLLTLAGAGSGKTSVLVCRTGYLLAVRQAEASSILLMTFSTKAAAEMRERIAQLPGIGGMAAKRIEARTFHSFFLYMLRRNGVREEIFGETIRQHILLKQFMREAGISDSQQPETLLALLSSYKMNLVDPAELPEKSEAERKTKEVLLRYEAWKRENGKLDFDDILLVAYEMLKERPGLLRSLQQRFRYVMVDEFQDTNFLQYELVKMIVEPHRNLMVVGDDDQTIYSFNGARSEFILDFEKTYPGAKVITLDINYRSTSAIVGLGNAIIRHNKKRRDKTLKATKQSETVPQYMTPFNTNDEAVRALRYIQQEVAEDRRTYGDFAILYRANSNNRAIIEQLLEQDVPFVEFGDGKLLYEQRIVRPVIDHMRLALYRRDFEAMESVLPTLYIAREKGMTFIRQQDALRAKKGPLIHLLSWPELKEFQKEKVKERLLLIKSLVAMKPVDAIVQLRRSFYDNYLETAEKQNVTQHKEMLVEMLDELETSAGRFDTLEAFLGFIDDMLEKSGEHARQKHEDNGNYVTLMTIHRSKGLEFPVVLLLGASEGSLPHSSSLDPERMKDSQLHLQGAVAQLGDDALEEERRLAYVAVTRAKEELVISSPAQYRRKKTAVSRFLLAAFGSAETAKTAAKEFKRGGALSGVRVAPSSMSGGVRAAQEGRKETVAAWLCKRPGCKAWMRVTTAEDAARSTKACPLCGKPMEKGTREVPAG
ncbi:DNA helicase-2/ATP-dependent DNA helicase PcrA [Paenibacillus phyllosphaerae]|uniref:DNA 3'-5' helicase n=1 Tax=Paenibacillus phyllosphaerae TaxID=274593 RepID=A0A7W5AZ53_9BACL|nr:UvrD-helicase domain-containing protein [Paenibacillus phyllosphaerae]MBB3110781.1 DNA helicase-2/ATP-dependent DNA helicase PcrA [Paenibacillus phyllosphaerae]